MELVFASFRVAAASAASMLAPVRPPTGSSLPKAGRPSTSFAAAPCGMLLAVSRLQIWLHTVWRLCTHAVGPVLGMIGHWDDACCSSGSEGQPQLGSHSLQHRPLIFGLSKQRHRSQDMNCNDFAGTADLYGHLS